MNLPEDFVYSKQRNDDYSVTPEVLTRRIKFLNLALDRFWCTWREEYLLELRSSHSLSQRERKSQRETLLSYMMKMNIEDSGDLD